MREKPVQPSRMASRIFCLEYSWDGVERESCNWLKQMAEHQESNLDFEGMWVAIVADNVITEEIHNH